MDRNEQKQRKMDRKREKHTETNRNGLKWTETDIIGQGGGMKGDIRRRKNGMQ